MTCIIVEDQPPAQRVLKKYIDDLGSLTLKGTFSDALLAMEFLQREAVDLIFLDIHLPKISGIDFLKTLTRPPLVNSSPSCSLVPAWNGITPFKFDSMVILRPFS